MYLYIYASKNIAYLHLYVPADIYIYKNTYV